MPAAVFVWDMFKGSVGQAPGVGHAALFPVVDENGLVNPYLAGSSGGLNTRLSCSNLSAA
jgi:hypothetical protein